MITKHHTNHPFFSASNDGTVCHKVMRAYDYLTRKVVIDGLHGIRRVPSYFEITRSNEFRSFGIQPLKWSKSEFDNLTISDLDSRRHKFIARFTYFSGEAPEDVLIMFPMGQIPTESDISSAESIASQFGMDHPDGMHFIYADHITGVSGSPMRLSVFDINGRKFVIANMYYFTPIRSTESTQIFVFAISGSDVANRPVCRLTHDNNVPQSEMK